MRTTVLLLVLAGVLASHGPISRAAENNVTTIFKCKIDGVTTFSDRPCGQDAQPQALDAAAINTYAPPAGVPRERPPDRSPSGAGAGARERLPDRSPNGAGAGARERPPDRSPNGAKPTTARDDRSEAKRKESCSRYAKGLKEIRSKLRSGYTAKEGERLRMRAEKLKDSQRQYRCS
jgi:hypothetical protein